MENTAHKFYDVKGNELNSSQFELITIEKEHSQHGTLSFQTWVPRDVGTWELYIGMKIIKAWILDKFKIAARSAFCSMFERETDPVSIETAAESMLFWNPFERVTNGKSSKVNNAVSAVKASAMLDKLKSARGMAGDLIDDGMPRESVVRLIAKNYPDLSAEAVVDAAMMNEAE